MSYRSEKIRAQAQAQRRKIARNVVGEVAPPCPDRIDPEVTIGLLASGLRAMLAVLQRGATNRDCLDPKCHEDDCAKVQAIRLGRNALAHLEAR